MMSATDNHNVDEVSTETINAAIKAVSKSKSQKQELGGKLTEEYYDLISSLIDNYDDELTTLATGRKATVESKSRRDNWSSLDDYDKALTVLNLLKTPRVSPEDVVGINIPISRVRAVLDYGLNDQFNSIIKHVEDMQKNKEPMKNLSSDQKEIVDIGMNRIENTLNRKDKNGNPKIVKFKVKDTKTVETRENTNGKQVTYHPSVDVLWEDMDDYQKALESLNKSKYRISQTATVSLASVVDSITHDVALHAIRRTIANNMTNINPKFMLDGIDKLSTYPIISKLRAYKDFVNECKFDKAFESRYAESLHEWNSSWVVNPKLTKEQQKEEKDESKKKLHASVYESLCKEYGYDTNNVSNETDDITEGNSRRVMNFSFYVGNIARMHIDSKSESPVRVSDVFKKLVSNMLVEFIQRIMSDAIRVFLNQRHTKTVGPEQICNTIILILQLDDCSYDDLIDLAVSRCDLLERFNDKRNESQDTDFDPTEYIYDVSKFNYEVCVREPKVEKTPKVKQLNSITVQKPVNKTQKHINKPRNNHKNNMSSRRNVIRV